MAVDTPVPTSAAAIVDQLAPGTNIVVPTANGEPTSIIDALFDQASNCEGIRVHQVFGLRSRDYHLLDARRLRYISYFLSAALREPFARGEIDLVPTDLSAMPALMQALPNAVLVAACSPPDEYGYVSLGCGANYAATLIGRVPTFLEANPNMPHTPGHHRVHLSTVAGWCEADYPLITVEPATATEVDRAIAAHVAERIVDGSTLQIGVGAVPDAIAASLTDHRDLGIHTELFSDGLRVLIECGAATGARKRTGRNLAITTDALGSPELLRFLDGTQAVEFWAVNETNDFTTIAAEPNFVAINATMQVDLLGQCASESLGTHYISGSGGQSDFMNAARYSPGGQSFMVTHATANTSNGPVSRIVAELAPGAVVTTRKNSLDKVATEFGVAELQGASIAARARALIAIAHPDHREALERDARRLGYTHD
jgi:acyl-CoA hydrolase